MVGMQISHARMRLLQQVEVIRVNLVQQEFQNTYNSETYVKLLIKAVWALRQPVKSQARCFETFSGGEHVTY
jgi:hypothetical protein